MAKKKSGSRKPSSPKTIADMADTLPDSFSPNEAMEMLRMLAEQSGLDPLDVISMMMSGDAPGDAEEVSGGRAPRRGKIKPGSVDDLVIKASNANSPEKALLLLEEAVQKGEKELKREFRDNVGAFWKIPRTQSYMLARKELICCLLELEKFDESIHHMKEMLRLDQSDYVGIRWLLLEWYCRLNQIDNARALIQKFPEDESAMFSITSVCLDFQKSGRTEELDAKLAAALEKNPYVSEELLNPDLNDVDGVSSFAVGSPEEAILYGRHFRSLWKSTPGAITWLRDIADQVEGDLDSTEVEVELLAEDAIKEAMNLKKCKEVWFVDIDVMDDDGNSIGSEVEWSTAASPDDWIMSVINAENNDLVRIEPGEFSLTPAGAIVELCATMLEPSLGNARRPKTVQCLRGLLCQELQDVLKQLKIALEEVDEIPELIQFMRRQRINDVPGEFPLDQILDLPLIGEAIWEIDWRMIDAWIQDPETGEAAQPWITLVCSPQEGIVRAQHVSQAKPTREVIAATLAKAILEPLQGVPGRPFGLIVRQLSNRFDIDDTASSIECGVVIEETKMTDHVMQSMEEHRTGGSEHEFEPLIRTEDMTPEILEDLFKASASYFKSRIYTKVRAESAIEITCPEISKKPLYAVVMGQNGQEIGVMVFFSLKAAQGMFRSRSNDFDSLAKKMAGIGYSIGPREQLHPLDVAAAEQFGWPVPAEDAWPSTYNIEKGKIRALTTAQVRLTTIAIIATMEAHQQSTASAVIAIRLFDREVQVTTKKVNL